MVAATSIELQNKNRIATQNKPWTTFSDKLPSRISKYWVGQKVHLGFSPVILDVINIWAGESRRKKNNMGTLMDLRIGKPQKSQQLITVKHIRLICQKANQSLSHVQLSATPWTAARHTSLSITNSWSPHKPMSIESVMPSNHLILCRPLLLLPSIFPSIRFFSNDSTLPMRWPKYWSFSFSISPSNEHPGLISFRMDWLDLLAVQGTRVFSNTTVQKHHSLGTQFSSPTNSHIHTWPLENHSLD